MARDIYSEPFLSYWPTPLSFRECFKSSGKTEERFKKNSAKNYFAKNGDDVGIIKSFWNVLSSPLGFRA